MRRGITSNMQIIKVKENEFSEYDNFVATHPGGSFLQSREWGNFQKSTGAEIFKYIFKQDGKTVGTAQIFLKNIAGINQKYVYCPYGPLTASGTEDINPFIEQLKIDFPNIIFIRIEAKHDFKLIGVETIRIQPHETIINDLSKSTEEVLAMMHPKTRYNIKLAEKHGVVVDVVNPNSDEVSKCIQLFEETSQRQQFKNFPESYYRTMIKQLGSSFVKLYQAKYNDQILATALMVDFAGTRTYLYGGSTNQNRNVMAPYALHWKAIQDAKQNGLNFYDWWGLRTSDGKISGFTEFKLKFGGQEINYPAAIDIINKPAWYNVYKVLRKINRFILHLPFLR